MSKQEETFYREDDGKRLPEPHGIVAYYEERGQKPPSLPVEQMRDFFSSPESLADDPEPLSIGEKIRRFFRR